MNEDRPDLRGADCSICRGKFDCFHCPERPFGSAPCPDPDMFCDECPTSQICAEIAEREWPLAEIALKMAGVL
jgi:hypothetical protein